MISIAVFGKISAGKSSLLNALFETEQFAADVRGGTTTVVRQVEATLGRHAVMVADTPGILEVGGHSRAHAARQAAASADLILFVCDHDLLDREFRELEALASAGKPLLVALNKSDILSHGQRETLLGRITERLERFIAPENILTCAASPLRHRVYERADGETEEVIDRGDPQIARIRQRLLEILERDAGDLRRLNDARREAGEVAERLKPLARQASATIENYSLGIAAGVAVNPIPLLDFFGGGALIIKLVASLAELYGVEMDQREITDLAKQVVRQGLPELWPTVIPIAAGSLLKGAPFVGWLLGATGQAIGAFYITTVLGELCSRYFAANRKWHGSLRATLREIIQGTDKKSVCARAAELLKAKLDAMK